MNVILKKVFFFHSVVCRIQFLHTKRHIYIYIYILTSYFKGIVIQFLLGEFEVEGTHLDC